MAQTPDRIMYRVSEEGAAPGSIPSAAWTKAVAWLLGVSYGLGAPLVAVLEYQNALFSERFDLPTALVYFTCAAQVVCVPFLFSDQHAAKAAMLLSVFSLGAVFSHLRIGSPLTALPGLVFTGLQLWFAARVRARCRLARPS